MTPKEKAKYKQLAADYKLDYGRVLLCRQILINFQEDPATSAVIDVYRLVVMICEMSWSTGYKKQLDDHTYEVIRAINNLARIYFHNYGISNTDLMLAIPKMGDPK